MATMVAKKISHTLGTYVLDILETHKKRIALEGNKFDSIVKSVV
jgi:hypothetical protein